MKISHRLLQRQIRKYLNQEKATDPEWEDFLAAVNQSYIHFEEDRALVERAMKISSDELWEKNQQMLLESERQKILITTLKQAIEQISPDMTIQQDVDLLRIADILNEEIRKRREAEDELHLAHKAVETSLMARQSFLMNISHEIRTPLHAIMGMTNLLNQTGASETQQEYLRVITHSADGLLVIINDLLDLGRIESGKFSLDFVSQNLDELFDNIRKSMWLKASEKSIDFRVVMDNHISPWLVCDPTRLQQVLLNLVSNAIKFTNRGTVELSAKLEHDADTEQIIRFEVMDTGIGIEAEKLERIFDQFQQAEAGTARKYGGTGLGLSISQSLVNMMGSRIEVYSRPGEGSRFRFSLKMSKGEKVPVQREAPFTPDGFNGLRVLIAEDNEINRYLTQSLLSGWGCTVSVVPDGRACVEYLKNEQTDIVLMDIQMPEMDGVTATECIRNELKLDVPIVALTANSLDEEVGRCLEAGMNSCLIKPFRPAELYQVITNVCPQVEAEPDSEMADGFDLSRLYELYNHNQQRVEETTRVFLKQLKGEIVQLRSQAGSADISGVLRLLHKMKSNLELFGMKELLAICISLEKELPQTSSIVASVRIAGFASSAEKMAERLSQMAFPTAQTPS
jgi:signal transduction histidine kinase/CheY-like chemotaxis protein/HPt (histidine-containing phosphotransfer) domain-containing protein